MIIRLTGDEQPDVHLAAATLNELGVPPYESTAPARGRRVRPMWQVVSRSSDILQTQRSPPSYNLHIRRDRGFSGASPADIDVVVTVGRLSLDMSMRRLWNERLGPLFANLSAEQPAHRVGPAIVTAANSDWLEQGRRLRNRLISASNHIIECHHIGSTSVSGLPAKDVIDLQVVVAEPQLLHRVSEDLLAHGFPKYPGQWSDLQRLGNPLPMHSVKHFHANADPGRPVNVHVRVADAPDREFSVAFRDWLRANGDERETYSRYKQTLASSHAGDATTASYAEAKAEWVRNYAERRIEQWIIRSNWRLPRY